MSLIQFQNSIRNILKNSHINKAEAIFRHIQWQLRKTLNGFPYEQKFSNSRIVAKHNKCGVSALINAQGLYDFNNMNLVKILLRDGGVFLDIGANIGSYSLIASEQSNASVFSFEPHPVTFSLLKENIELNHRHNVGLFNIALGNKNGEVFLTNKGGSPINHIENIKSDSNISVKCQRADSFCKENKVVPRFVKIDVEGYEYDVLEGFGDYLKEVDLFFLEMNGLSDSRSTGREAIQKLLRDNYFSGPYYFNFDCHTFTRSFNHEDCLFVSRSFFKNGSFRLLE